MRRLLLLTLASSLLAGPGSFAQDPAGGRRGQATQGETKPQQERRQQDRQGAQPARQRENAQPRRPETQPQPALDRVAFRWGPGGRVQVRETETVPSAEGERKLVSQYDLRWMHDGNGVAVSRQPRAFQTLGDEPAPRDAKPLRARRVQDLLAPALAIEETGAFRSFAPPADPETLAKKLEGEGDSGLATDLRAARAEPATQLRARQEARDAWEAWFGAWHGLPIRTGDPLETERPAYTGFGVATAKAKMRLAHMGTLERGGETCAHLELRTSHAGPDLAEAIRSTPALAKDPGMERIAASIQGRTAEMQGLFGLATGRPHRVSVTVTTTFDDGAGGTRTQVDAREYAFDWAQAQTLPAGAGSGGQGAGARPGGRDGGAQPRPQGKPGQKQDQPGRQGQPEDGGKASSQKPKRD